MSFELINKIVAEFDPMASLPINDRRYVECSIERGSEGILNDMAGAIRHSQLFRINRPSQRSVCLLFSGHRGCGKTTELFRLQRLLTMETSAPFVVYCEADDYLDTNDVEYQDVLLAIVQQLCQAAKIEDVQLQPTKIARLFQELAETIQSLHPKEMGIDVSIFSFLKGNLKAEFKSSEQARSLVRGYLRDRAQTFLESTNEIVRIAEGNFRDRGYSGLVVIVDNLDRIFLKPIADTRYNTHEALFVHAGDYLSGLVCDVIYTIPPTLCSLNGPQLTQIYGTDPVMLPMIPVIRRFEVSDAQQPKVDAAGIAKLIETVEKRLNEAGVTATQVFDSPETLNRLCFASGGHMRRLIALMRSVCYSARDLPFTREAVERAIRQMRNSFISSVQKPEEWKLLREVHENKSITNPEACARLLDNYVILEYRDEDGPWHDVSPVIREARQFNE